MSQPGRITDRLRLVVVLVVAFTLSGLIVLASSYSAFDPPASNPVATTPNPGVTVPGPSR